MEISKLGNVKKFVREALGLSDNSHVQDFNISTISDCHKLVISATITHEISLLEFEDLKTPIKDKKQKENKIVKNAIGTRSYAKGSLTIDREFEYTKDDFNCIRKILADLRKQGKLTDDETEKMASFAGKFFKSMSQEEKEEFMGLFQTVRHSIMAGHRSKSKQEAYEHVASQQ